MKLKKYDKNKKVGLKELISHLLVIPIAIVLGILLSSEVFAIADVRERSMEDTLFEGEKLFVSKLAYRFNEPVRGDVVIFLKEEEVGGFFKRFWISACDVFDAICRRERENRLVKRVIGLPGEVLEIRNGKIYIDYVELEEEYVRGITIPDDLGKKFTLPEDMFFVMGDNRDHFFL